MYTCIVIRYRLLIRGYSWKRENKITTTCDISSNLSAILGLHFDTIRYKCKTIINLIIH